MKSFATFLLIAVALSAGAWAADPDAPTLRWHVNVVPVQGAPADVVEVVFTADILSGWILYSSDFNVEIGPRPTRFTFDANPSLTPLGVVAAPGSHRKKDPTFRTEYSYFSDHAEFRQRVRVLAPVKTVSGGIDGQTCFEQSGLCQLFHESFSANVP